MSLLEGSRQTSTADASVSARRLKDAVEHAAHATLFHSGYAILRTVRCDFHEGVLTLRGCVPSYYLKQIAQTLVRRLDRVELIENRLEVAISTTSDDPVDTYLGPTEA